MNDDPYIQYGFDGAKPTPPDPIALKFAHKISNILHDERQLIDAKLNVPDYTGQWSEKDYYAKHEEEYNRSVDDLWNFVKENVK